MYIFINDALLILGAHVPQGYITVVGGAVSHKSPFVVVLNITTCSLDININFVRTTASDKRQE